MTLDLSSIQQALKMLSDAHAAAVDSQEMSRLSSIQQTTIRAGVIQHFEFTYELCWKFMKRWLAFNLGDSQTDGLARNHLFRLAAEHGLIIEISLWMDYHKARNLTTHTYNQSTADEVFEVVAGFIERARFLVHRLQEKNA
jgi:nucleotidyltransferase substrate binding protein (TIGR01987 family)